MSQRRLIGVLKLSAQRYALRKTRKADRVAGGQAGDVMRCGFAFHGRIGRDDDFLDRFVGQTSLELVQSDIIRADAIQRRQPAQKHKITPIEAGGLLDCEYVTRRFDHA